MRVELEDGKYTYICHEDGTAEALRYGASWKRDLSGDKFVYCMAAEIVSLRQQLTDARAAIAHEADVAESYKEQLDAAQVKIVQLTENIAKLDSIKSLTDAVRSLSENEQLLRALADTNVGEIYKTSLESYRAGFENGAASRDAEVDALVYESVGVVDITEIERCLRYFKLINNTELDDIVWMRGDDVLVPTPEEQKEFLSIGLSNRDFPSVMGWMPDDIGIQITKIELRPSNDQA